MTAVSIDALRDIHLPPEPALSWLPESGIVLGALLLAIALWHVWRRRSTRASRAALRTLSALADAHARDGDATAFARGLSRLLRQHAIHCFPRSGVERLTGKAWLQFLDAHGGAGAFCDGAGALLDARPYQAAGEIDGAALVMLARRWLEANPR